MVLSFDMHALNTKVFVQYTLLDSLYSLAIDDNLTYKTINSCEKWIMMLS